VTARRWRRQILPAYFADYWAGEEEPEVFTRAVARFAATG
jgi:hypothetical protein